MSNEPFPGLSDEIKKVGNDDEFVQALKKPESEATEASEAAFDAIELEQNPMVTAAKDAGQVAIHGAEQAGNIVERQQEEQVNSDHLTGANV